MVISVWPVRVVAQSESIGDKVKKIFATPTPTPHKRHKSSPSPSPKKKSSPKPSPSAHHSPSASPSKKSAEESPEETPAATPHAKKKSSSKTSQSPSPSPHGKHHRKTEEQSPSPGEKAESSPSQTPTPSASPTESPSATASPAAEKGKGTHAPVATLNPGQVADYDTYPENVRRILDRGLSLTTQNLDYKYGSADPASGGMDCSGFIYYVLSQNGMKDVPRDAREQYIWTRKAGTFRAVLGHHDDTFELDELKPGDLLFWTGTYKTDKDPNITHTMIYLGREKGRNQRVMVGSSDGRIYNGQSRFGVSVFDFKVTPPRAGKTDDRPGPVFVGYGRIPGLDK